MNTACSESKCLIFRNLEDVPEGMIFRQNLAVLCLICKGKILPS